jgi:chromosome segregation ATPase
MGPVMSPEDQRKVNEQIRQRKEEIAKSLGITVEEMDERQKTAPVEHEPIKAEQEAIDEDIDEQKILRYIQTRQAIIDEQRGRINSLEMQVAHGKNQLAMAERKIESLRKALETTRAQLAEMKAQAQASENAPAPAPSQGGSSK